MTDNPKFDFHNDQHLDAIEGCISTLASYTNRPSGYPFKSVTIYCMPPFDEVMQNLLFAHQHGLDRLLSEIQATEIIIKSAEQLEDMKSLDFKKAGPIIKDKVNEVKILLKKKNYKIEENGDYIFDNGCVLPKDCITIKSIIPSVKNSKEKIVTGNGLYLIEVNGSDSSEHWLAISFKKSIKEYLTENLKLNITHSIFGGPGNPLCFAEERDAEAYDYVARVHLTVVKCSEKLYQSLEKYGDNEFCKNPINLKLFSREEYYHKYDEIINLPDQFEFIFGDETAKIVLNWEYGIQDKDLREIMKKEFIHKLSEYVKKN